MCAASQRSLNEASIRELNLRLKEVDMAIQSLEELQRLRAKRPALVMAKRILIRAA